MECRLIGCVGMLLRLIAGGFAMHLFLNVGLVTVHNAPSAVLDVRIELFGPIELVVVLLCA